MYSPQMEQQQQQQRSLHSRPPMSTNEPLNGKIYFTLPSFYVKYDCPYVNSVNNDNNVTRSRIVENLRAIEPHLLCQYVKEMEMVPNLSIEEISTKFVILLQEIQNEETANIVQFVNKLANKLVGETPPDSQFANINTIGTSHDIIREYVFCNGIYRDAVIKPYEQYKLYSQIHDPELIKHIRMIRNDNEISRALYSLKQLELYIALEPTYLPHTTHEISMAIIYLMVLASVSHPIIGEGDEDLVTPYVGYMIDILARTRLIESWRKFPTTKLFMQDLSKNFNTSAILPKICRKSAAKERAELVLNLLNTNHTNNLCDQRLKTLKYDKYMEVVETQLVTHNGELYYLIDSDFMSKLMKHMDIDPTKLFNSFNEEFDQITGDVLDSESNTMDTSWSTQEANNMNAFIHQVMLPNQQNYVTDDSMDTS